MALLSFLWPPGKHFFFFVRPPKPPPNRARTPARTPCPDHVGREVAFVALLSFLWPQGEHFFCFCETTKTAPNRARTPARTPCPDSLPTPYGAHGGATCVPTASCPNLSKAQGNTT